MVTGPVTETAKAVAEMARTSRSSPRTAIVAVALVMSLAVVLAFVYLVMKLPDDEAPLATKGNWLTQDQFRVELAERDRKLAPATEAALKGVQLSIDALREEIRSVREFYVLQREETKTSESRLLATVTRVEERVVQAGERIDRLYEAAVKPGK